MLQVANQPGPFYCFLRPLVFELMRRGIEVDVACNSGDPRFPELARAGMRTVPLTVGSWRSGPVVTGHRVGGLTTGRYACRRACIVFNTCTRRRTRAC